MNRYQTGTREAVLRYMAECAIRDRLQMIDCHARKACQKPSPESLAVIADCRAAIADFKRLVSVSQQRQQAQGGEK